MNDMPTSNGDGRSMSGLIQWPHAQYWDKPWNPVVGCEPISPACDNCYARAMAKRFKQQFMPHESVSNQTPPRKGVVFCGNMTDLFGDWLDKWDIMAYIAKCALRWQGTQYLWLTKRVRNMTKILQCFSEQDLDNPKRGFSNHYFGFTAEDQDWFNRRFMPWFRFRPDWVNGWLSAEPLLGHISLGVDSLKDGFKPFKWVVVGCESGVHRRPCKIEWVESIVEQCKTAKIPVFVKQLDLNGQCETDINKFPAHLQIRQVPWAKEEGTK